MDFERAYAYYCRRLTKMKKPFQMRCERTLHLVSLRGCDTLNKLRPIVICFFLHTTLSTLFTENLNLRWVFLIVCWLCIQLANGQHFQSLHFINFARGKCVAKLDKILNCSPHLPLQTLNFANRMSFSLHHSCIVTVILSCFYAVSSVWSSATRSTGRPSLVPIKHVSSMWAGNTLWNLHKRRH